MATKRGKSASPTLRLPIPIRRLTAFLWGPGRMWTLAVLMVVALAGACYGVWRTLGDEILASDQYQVTADRIEITPLPRWIQSDVRGEVFRSINLNGPLSIMNPDATKRVANAFSSHPWVAGVVSVSKYHPARLQVELQYRRPVCMVEVPGGMRPVDVRGVCLPCGDFSSVEASHYPRVVGVDSSPIGPPGNCWGDARVVGAAEVANALGETWGDLKLDRIVATPRPDSGSRDDCLYELHTRLGTRIFWGRAPGAKLPSEPLAEDKVARLKKYAAQYGSLEGMNGPQDIDLRDKEAIRVHDRLAQMPKEPAR
jgi:hypothetical protein